MKDFFDRVEDEFRGAMLREQSSLRPLARAQRRLRRLVRPRAAAVLALVIAVPAGAAATGIFPQREPDGLVRTAPKTLIAKGEDPEFGAWEAFVSDSAEGRCFGLRLLDPPGVQEGTTSEGCGVVAGKPARIGGGDGPPRVGLFGFVPAEATEVLIEADGVPSRRFRTFRHPAIGAEAFFLATLPVSDPKGLQVEPLVNGVPVRHP